MSQSYNNFLSSDVKKKISISTMHELSKLGITLSIDEFNTKRTLFGKALVKKYI